MEPSLLPGILADILAEPHRDDLRLLAADWWDDLGQADRAEFIRVQVELWPYEAARKEGEWLCRWPIHTKNHPEGRACEVCPPCVLRRREQELLNKVGRRIMGALPGPTWTLHPNDNDYPDYPKVTFRRGFVAEVSCSVRNWLAHGPALVLCQPLERVTLSDLTLYGPLEYGPERGRWFWLLRDMPKELQPYMGFMDRTGGGAVAAMYVTKKEAEYALSLAALTWAREQAARCPRCDERGWISLQCPDCGGTGKRGRTGDIPLPLAVTRPHP